MMQSLSFELSIFSHLLLISFDHSLTYIYIIDYQFYNTIFR